MGCDYVERPGDLRGGETIWRETSVGRMNLKSIVGRVTRSGNGSVGIMAAAWSDGTPIRSVELRIDDGEWRPMELVEGGKATHAWKFYRYNWTSPAAGEHTLVTRATDARGRVQPAKEDPAIKLKKTYWEANQQYPRKIAL